MSLSRRRLMAALSLVKFATPTQAASAESPSPVDLTPTALDAFVREVGATGAAADFRFMLLAGARHYGARGDGSTDDSAALNRAGASGVPLTLQPGTYRCAAPVSFASAVTLLQGASFSGTGALVFEAGLTAPLARVFAGSNAVTISPGREGARVSPEWWGAVTGGAALEVARGNVSAIRAAFAAISRGGVDLQSGVYHVDDATGPTAPYLAYRGAGANRTVLVNTSTTTDTLRIDGASAHIDGCAISGIGTSRAVTPASASRGATNPDGTLMGAKGLRLAWTANAVIDDVVCAEDGIGFYQFNNTGATLTRTRAVRSRGGRGDSYFGYVMDGSGSGAHAPPAGTSANGSLVLNDPNVVCGGFAGTSTGYWSFGDVRDQWFDTPQALASNGIVITGGALDFDVSIQNPIIDGFTGTGISIAGLGPSGMVTITGGWTNPGTPAPSEANIALTTRGFNIVGHKFFGGSAHAMQTGLSASNASDSSVTACSFKNLHIGALLDACGQIALIGNSFFNIAGQNGANAIKLTAASRCAINGNTVSGGAPGSWSAAILADAATTHSSFVGNAVNVRACAFPLSIAGQAVASEGVYNTNRVLGVLD